MRKRGPIFWTSLSASVIVVIVLVLPKIVGTRGSHSYEPVSQMSTIQEMLQHFHLDCGRYPTTAEGLWALRHCPPGLERKWGPDAYASRDIVDDCFGHPYLYSEKDDHYILTSLGEDGVLGGEGYGTDLVVSD